VVAALIARSLSLQQLAALIARSLSFSKGHGNHKKVSEGWERQTSHPSSKGGRRRIWRNTGQSAMHRKAGEQIFLEAI